MTKEDIGILKHDPDLPFLNPDRMYISHKDLEHYYDVNVHYTYSKERKFYPDYILLDGERFDIKSYVIRRKKIYGKVVIFELADYDKDRYKYFSWRNYAKRWEVR